MSPANGSTEGRVSLSFSCLTVRGGMVCCRSMHSCPTQFPLCCSVHSEPPSCCGIMAKGQHINIERNLRVPAGRPVGFSLHHPLLTLVNCTTQIVILYCNSLEKLTDWSTDVYWGFQNNNMGFVSIRIAGACAEGSFWLHFCMLICVFLIQLRDQCLSEFANLMSANLYLGFGIPHSVLGYPFHKQR